MVNNWIKENQHKEDLGLKNLAKVHNKGDKKAKHGKKEKSVKLQNLSIFGDIAQSFDILSGNSNTKVVGKAIAYDTLKR